MLGTTAGSTLRVLRDHSVEHTEAVCCPNLAWDVSEAPLMDSEWNRVVGLAQGSTRGLLVSREAPVSISWTPEGFLQVYATVGSAAQAVYSLKRKSYGDRLYFFETKLASPDTEALLDWIRGKVRVGPLK